MQNKTTWGQTKWSIFFALIDSSIYHNKWLLLHLTKRGKRQTAWLFIFIFHQLWMTLTEQSVVPCQPNPNLLHIECWQGFVRFKSHHIWQGRMFCCCTKKEQTVKSNAQPTVPAVLLDHSVIHLTALKINHMQRMKKQSSRFKMGCLWRIRTVFYGENKMCWRVRVVLTLKVSFSPESHRKCQSVQLMIKQGHLFHLQISLSARAVNVCHIKPALSSAS